MTFRIAGVSSIRDGRTLVVGTVVRSGLEEALVEPLEEPVPVALLLELRDDVPLVDELDELLDARDEELDVRFEVEPELDVAAWAMLPVMIAATPIDSAVIVHFISTLLSG